MQSRVIDHCCCFFFSSRRRHTRCLSDWSSDVCSSDLKSRVVLSMAAKIGHQIVALKYPPVNSFDQFRIDTSPDCHREGRIAKTRCADMRSSEEQVCKRRYTRRP